MLKRSTLPATERSLLKQLSKRPHHRSKQGGIAAGVVSLIAALSTSSADSAAIILDLIFIERLSPISFIFSNLMENKNIILL